jgi:hypothetical protein
MGVIGKRKAPWTVEDLARKIAFWHGQRIVGQYDTVASSHGYGLWGHSPEKYAENHWREYTAAAQAILSDLKK